MRSFLRQFAKQKEFSILTMLIIIAVIITMQNSVFISAANLIDILRSNSIMGIIALGMLLVIITGGIDVSVGAMTAMVTVIIGNYMAVFGGSLITVFLLAAISGIALGIINGILVAKLKIPAIVVTLGMMSIFNGLTLYITNGSWITDVPQYFIQFGKIKIFNIPIQIYFWLGTALLTFFILKYTFFGRGIFALGGNPEVANRVGYKSDKLTICLWAYLGLMVGVAAVIHTSIFRQVDPNAFNGFELNVIAAVVLGGANIMGGEGSVPGTILGVLLLAVIDNGLILAWVPTFWQQIIVGSIILIAVSYDVIQNKRKERSMMKIDLEE
ncbi:MAG: ABC transporter permease [Firmicutes bacterium]|nr:ABC transporter permease [Bacillota bacterium]